MTAPTSNLRSSRRSLILFASSLAVVSIVLVFGVSTFAVDRTPAPDRLAAERVKRGEYLVSIAGCHDCHTPWIMGPDGPGPDMTRMLSGHPHDLVVEPAKLDSGTPWAWAGAATNTAFTGPWGVSFTANLTPDVLTGIGSWSEDIFVNAIRNGKHWGQSRAILPPMPWKVYRNMTDEDLASVFAYLQSIPPVRNEVPLPLPPGGAPSEEPWN